MKADERVVVYGSLGLRRGISDLLWAFRKANKLEEFPAYLDDHPYQLMHRIDLERRNGMRSADVVLMPHYAVTAMGADGKLAGYQPATAKDIPPNMRATKAGAVPVGVTFMAMAYNTEVLSRAELPRGLSDLAGPSWRGKLGTQSLTASKAGNLGAWYLSYLKSEAGEKEWMSFVGSLGSGNRPVAYDCIDHLLQGLLDGDIQLALTVYSLAYLREKTSGSPIALVDDSRVSHMMTFTSAALLNDSKDSVPARKFMDFLLTKEAQKTIGTIPGIAPVDGGRPSYDFEHVYGDGTAFHPSGSDFREVESTVKLFQRLKLP